MQAKKRILVVYYSLTGNTARVARDLAARLDADVESIEDKRHGAGFLGYVMAALDALRKAPAPIGTIKYDPADYALTVIGTPVWVGQITPAVRTYLQQVTGKLTAAAFFNTSGDTAIDKNIPSLELAANCKASASAGFNARELGQADVYEQKLADFVQAINGAVARVPMTEIPTEKKSPAAEIEA